MELYVCIGAALITTTFFWALVLILAEVQKFRYQVLRDLTSVLIEQKLQSEFIHDIKTKGSK